MKRTAFLLCILVLALAAGCGPTTSTYIQTPGTEAVNRADGFKVGQVEDLSGFKFNEGDKDAFDLKEAMTSALRTQLSSQGLSIANALYTVNVNILTYEPGSAFARWLMPGTGVTRLTVEAMIVDKKGAHLAKIPVDRRIYDGFTIGGYKYIFDEVAQEIAAVIKNPAKAKGSSGQ
jgi:hypothetical protein